MKHKVLILSTSAGTGHVKSGEALEKAFAQRPEVESVRHFDALDFTNKLFRDFYSKLYARLVMDAPDFLGWWYKKTDEPWKTDKMRLMLDRLNTVKLVQYIKETEPDICLCTHFMPAGIISYLMEKEKLPTRLSIVVTDFDLHAMWLARNFHRYFVATDEIREHLGQLGFPSSRITVSGIPISPEFAQRRNPQKIRLELGLNPATTTILFSLSGLQEEWIETCIRSFCQIKNPLQVVVLCGRKLEVRNQIENLISKFSPTTTRFHLIGYTDKMYQWMNAADLYMGKPGGLTSSEAMAMGLPLVIVSPIPGQEERNSDYLLENDAAIKCPHLLTLRFKVERLVCDPDRIQSMKENALRIGRPDSSSLVVDTLLHDQRFSFLPSVKMQEGKKN